MVTEGFDDTYTPNPSIEAFAVAVGTDPIASPAQRAIEGLELQGRMGRQPPFSGYSIGGQTLPTTTVALGQYKQKANSDGHFVVFNVPAARTQSTQFLASLLNDGKATVVAP